MAVAGSLLESLHRGLRKIIKTRGSFPSDEAAMKLLYLVVRNLGVHCKPAIKWRAVYDIHGTYQGEGSAKSRCMSIHR